MPKLAGVPQKIDTVIRFFLYVLLFWQPYAPAVIESCVILSLILWFIKRVINYTLLSIPNPTFIEKCKLFLICLKPPSSPLNGMIYLFLGASVCSVITSIFFLNSLMDFLTKFCEWFVVYFLVIETFKKPKHFKIAFIVLIVTVLGTLVDTFIQYYITQKDIFNGRLLIESDLRATAGFKAPNSLGAYCAFLIPIFFMQAWGARGAVQRVLYFCVLLLLLWASYLTLSRGSWLGCFIGMSVLTFLRGRNVLSKVKWVGVAVGVCLIVLGAAFYIKSGRLTDGLSRPTTIQWRFKIWKESLRMIKDRPVFGHGVNTFMPLYQFYRYRARASEYPNPTYAHNCYVQLAVETGVVGLVLFLGIIGFFVENTVMFFRNIHDGWNKDMFLAAGLFMGCVASLVHSFFDTNLYSLQLVMLLWFAIGWQVAILEYYKSINKGVLHATT